MTLMTPANIETISETLLDHDRIRQALHDRKGSPPVKSADVNYRILDMCQELVDTFGLTDDSDAMKVAIIPNADFDKMAFRYELITDPDQLEKGNEAVGRRAQNAVIEPQSTAQEAELPCPKASPRVSIRNR